MEYERTGYKRSLRVLIDKTINEVQAPGYPKQYPTVQDYANGYFVYSGIQYPIPTEEQLGKLPQAEYDALSVKLRQYVSLYEPCISFPGSFSNTAEIYDPENCPLPTTTTTEEPEYRAAMYVGPDDIEPLTEVIIAYQENVQIVLNSPVYPGVNYLFISIPQDKTLIVKDMFMLDVTSEFMPHSVQSVSGYIDNIIYRKIDVFDTTGSTVFFLTINS